MGTAIKEPTVCDLRKNGGVLEKASEEVTFELRPEEKEPAMLKVWRKAFQGKGNCFAWLNYTKTSVGTKGAGERKQQLLPLP